MCGSPQSMPYHKGAIGLVRIETNAVVYIKHNTLTAAVKSGLVQAFCDFQMQNGQPALYKYFIQ